MISPRYMFVEQSMLNRVGGVGAWLAWVAWVAFVHGFVGSWVCGCHGLNFCGGGVGSVGP